MSESTKESKVKKWNYDTIKEYMKDNSDGYKIFMTKDILVHNSVCFRCPEGHEYMSKFSLFKAGHRCPKCFSKKRHEFHTKVFKGIFNRSEPKK